MPNRANVLAPNYEEARNPEELRELHRQMGDTTLDTMVKLGETDDGTTVSAAPELMDFLQRRKDAKTMVSVDSNTEIAPVTAAETTLASAAPAETAAISVAPAAAEVPSAEAPVDSEAQRQARIAELERELARLKRQDAIDVEFTEVRDEAPAPVEATAEPREAESGPNPAEQNANMPSWTGSLDEMAMPPENEAAKHDAAQQAAGEGLGDLSIPSKIDFEGLNFLNAQTETGARRLVDWTEAKRLTEDLADRSAVNFDNTILLKSLYLKERGELMAHGMNATEADAWIMANRDLDMKQIQHFNEDVEDEDDARYYIGRGENILRRSQEAAQRAVAIGSQSEARKDEFNVGTEAEKAEKAIVETSKKMNELQAELENLSDGPENQARAAEISEEISRLSMDLQVAYDKRDEETFKEAAINEAGYAIADQEMASGKDLYDLSETAATSANGEALEDNAGSLVEPGEIIDTSEIDTMTPEAKQGLLEKIRGKLANVLSRSAGFQSFKRRVAAAFGALLTVFSLASCSAKNTMPEGGDPNAIKAAVTEAAKGAGGAMAGGIEGMLEGGDAVSLTGDMAGDVTGSPEAMAEGMQYFAYSGMHQDLSEFLSPEKQNEGMLHMGLSIAEKLKADNSIAPEEAIRLINENPAYLAGYACLFPDVLQAAGLRPNTTESQVLSAIYMTPGKGGEIQQALIDGVTAKFRDPDMKFTVRAGHGERIRTNHGTTRAYTDRQGNAVLDQNGNEGLRIDYVEESTVRTRNSKDTIIDWVFVVRDDENKIVDYVRASERADCRQIDRPVTTTTVKKNTPPKQEQTIITTTTTEEETQEEQQEEQQQEEQQQEEQQQEETTNQADTNEDTSNKDQDQTTNEKAPPSQDQETTNQNPEIPSQNPETQPGGSGEEQTGDEDQGEEDQGEEDQGEEDQGEEDEGEEDSGEEDEGEEDEPGGEEDEPGGEEEQVIPKDGENQQAVVDQSGEGEFVGQTGNVEEVQTPGVAETGRPNIGESFAQSNPVNSKEETAASNPSITEEAGFDGNGVAAETEASASGNLAADTRVGDAEGEAAQQAAEESKVTPSETGVNESLSDQAYEDYIESLLSQLGEGDIG